MDSDKKISTQSLAKSIDPIAYFENDGDFAFVFKKTEKLASAVYLVTSLMSENEPMKWTLRKKVSDLLSFNINYKDTGYSNQLDFSNSVKTRVLEIVSFLEVSFRGGLVSEMNFSVLKQEFSNLLQAFETSRATPGNTSLTKIFGETAPVRPVNQIETISAPKPQTTFREETHQAHTHTFIPAHHAAAEIKDRAIVLKDDEKRSQRQTTILNLIRKKKEVSINDIALVIKDCSEKTIQRELNSFIAAGVLKRAGVRRWSKYSLNN